MQAISDWQARLGGQIKEARERRGWTRQQLADLLGVKFETIRLYESGGIVPPLAKLKVIIEELRADFQIERIRIHTESPQPRSVVSGEQSAFSFYHEYNYKKAAVKVTATESELKIIASVPA